MTSAVRRALAWGVHFYTGLGCRAASIAVNIVKGTEASSGAGAFVWMIVATLIDATDGTLARAIHIKKVLPGFDGRRLDDLIDFLTYVALPLLLVWRAELLPAGTEAVLLLPLFAAAYGFCQVEAKTHDGYFLGFPSYWNIVAFYLYTLQPPGWLSVGMIATLSVLTFVPLRYLYPTMKGRLNLWSNVLSAPWAGLIALSLWTLTSNEVVSRNAAFASLYFPLFYFGASWATSVQYLLRARGQQPDDAEGGMIATPLPPRETTTP
ncbi:MAG: CDP-alcohol phosphatidyltransferase [Gemmataceae bacterium]